MRNELTRINMAKLRAREAELTRDDVLAAVTAEKTPLDAIAASLGVGEFWANQHLIGLEMAGKVYRHCDGWRLA